MSLPLFGVCEVTLDFIREDKLYLGKRNPATVSLCGPLQLWGP